MQAVLRRDAFDGRDALAFDLGGHDEATVDEPPVENDVARAAVAIVAAFLRAGQLQLVAQRFEEAHARLAKELGRSAVDGAGDVEFFGHFEFLFAVYVSRSQGVSCARNVNNYFFFPSNSLNSRTQMLRKRTGSP
jgi:hypothetical protein